MPAKIIALTQKDQDLLRVALTRAIEWLPLMGDLTGVTPDEKETTERIKDLKVRLV